VLQCVAVVLQVTLATRLPFYCSAFQCVAVCCRCVAVCCSGVAGDSSDTTSYMMYEESIADIWGIVLQVCCRWDAVSCWALLQRWRSLLQIYETVCCSVVQYVAGVLQVCCSVMLGSLAKIEESVADIWGIVLQCFAMCCSGVAGDSRPEEHLSSKTQF